MTEVRIASSFPYARASLPAQRARRNDRERVSLRTTMARAPTPSRLVGFIGFEDDRSRARWWSHMCDREREDPKFSLDAPYVKCRRLYVDSVWSLCEDHRLAETTAHVATRYYDLAMQREPAGGVLLEDFTLDEVRIAAVLIAAKFEEHEAPTLKAIRGPSRAASIEARRMRDAEAAVAARLNWRLSVVTALQCFEHLHTSNLIMHPSDLVRGAPLSRSPKARKFVVTYARFFCNMTLQSSTFQLPPPSKLAAAIVHATRQLLNIAPAWPDRLARFTGYADVAQLADDVLAYYQAEFPDHHQSVQTFASSPKSVADASRLFPEDAPPDAAAGYEDATRSFFN